MATCPRALGVPQNSSSRVVLFCQPNGTFGDAGRGIITGPKFDNLDTSVFKTFLLVKRTELQSLREVFNTLNVANYDSNAIAFGQAGYDQVSSEKPKRQMHFFSEINFLTDC